VSDDAPRTAPRWQWRTFPVLAAFIVGLTAGAFADGRPDSDFGLVVRVFAILGFAYVLIHMFVMNVIVAGRVKRREAGEMDDREEYEDVVVQPDE
jgi:hypothetical protein